MEENGDRPVVSASSRRRSGGPRLICQRHHKQPRGLAQTRRRTRTASGVRRPRTACGVPGSPNVDLGVFVDNSQGNVIGPGNVIAANEIAGVEILAQSSQNLVMGTRAASEPAARSSRREGSPA